LPSTRAIPDRDVFHVAHPIRSIQRFSFSRDADTSRYSVDVCDWCHMPLEPCPTCGYALSVLDHHCRHCAVPLRTFPSLRLFDTKQLSKMIIAVVVLSVLVYLIFFR
jgi:hypothetical protein